jgi:hypothetical protein
MKRIFASLGVVCLSAVCWLSILAFAAELVPPEMATSSDSPPACLAEQITIQQLKQQNAGLTQQLLQSYGELAIQAQRLQPLLQVPFQTSQEEGKAAERERIRLEGLRNNGSGVEKKSESDR